MRTKAEGTTHKEEPFDVLLQSLEEFFTLLVKRYNSTIDDELLQMSVQRQPQTPHQSPQEFSRLIVATSQWALSVRGRKESVDCFIIPATEIMTLPNSELPSRNKLTLKVHDREIGAWTVSDVVVTGDEMNALMRGLFKDVVSRTRSDLDGMPEPLRLIASGYSFAGAVRALMAEKQALVQKMVDQQEAILSSLAREIHDVVIGNVMLLKRNLSSKAGKAAINEEEARAILDEISEKLREICQDLYPRDLKDCGLRPLLEELCDAASSRIGCPCHFHAPETLPDFPTEVALHIFRIAQECLNNTAKHASASMASINIEADHGVFNMTIRDDGKGYKTSEAAQARTTAGGSGTGIIRERTELISVVYPAKIWFDSQPQKGTKIVLEVLYGGMESGASAQSGSTPSMRAVIYASQDIPAGEIITIDAVDEMTMDAGAVEDSAVSGFQSVVGKVAKVPLHQGQIIKSADLH